MCHATLNASASANVQNVIRKHKMNDALSFQAASSRSFPSAAALYARPSRLHLFFLVRVSHHKLKGMTIPASHLRHPNKCGMLPTFAQIMLMVIHPFDPFQQAASSYSRDLAKYLGHQSSQDVDPTLNAFDSSFCLSSESAID